jgi:hypothetical protein
MADFPGFTGVPGVSWEGCQEGVGRPVISGRGQEKGGGKVAISGGGEASPRLFSTEFLGSYFCNKGGRMAGDRHQRPLVARLLLLVRSSPANAMSNPRRVDCECPSVDMKDYSLPKIKSTTQQPGTCSPDWRQ